MMLSLINLQFIDSAINNHLDLLKNLLGQGANIHADNDKALRWAADSGQLEIVKYLLSWGANVHANNKALRRAAQNGHNDVWQVLSAFFQEKNC